MIAFIRHLPDAHPRFTLYPGACLLLLVATFSGCSTTYRPHAVSQFRQAMDPGIDQDPAMEQIIAAYRVQLAVRMDSVIAYGARRLTLCKPESPLGNLLADALLTESRVSFGENVTLAIINQGGIRLDHMPQGPLSQGYFFELLPFENQVVVVELDSTGTQQLLDKIARAGGWPIAGDFRITLQDTTIMSVSIQGFPLSGTRTYPVAMPDYLANGGDGCAFLQSYPRLARGELLRDLIVRHARNLNESGKNLDSDKDGRIQQIDMR